MRVNLIIIFVLGSHLFSIGQEKFQFGVKTGANFSFFSASMESSSRAKWGFHFGGYVKRRLGNVISVRPELYFSSQGEHDDYKEMPTGKYLGTTTTTTNYMNLPLLLQLGNKFNLQAGIQFGFLLTAKIEGEFGGTAVHDNPKEDMKSTDFSYVVGFGGEVGKHFTMGARYNIGASEIYKNSGSTFYPSIEHRVLHFYVGYTF